MNIGLAFDKTLKKYGITGKAIAVAADVSTGMVSRFRGGSAINTDSLEKMIAVLEEEPLRYFLTHIISTEQVHTSLQTPISTSELVAHLDERETASLLYALAAKIRNNSPQNS